MLTATIKVPALTSKLLRFREDNVSVIRGGLERDAPFVSTLN